MTCLLTVIRANWKSTFLLRKWNHPQCWHMFPDSWNKWTVQVSWNHAAGGLQTYLLLLAGSQSAVNQCHTRWMKALEWLCTCWCPQKAGMNHCRQGWVWGSGAILSHSDREGALVQAHFHHCVFALCSNFAWFMQKVGSYHHYKFPDSSAPPFQFNFIFQSHIIYLQRCTSLS